MSAPLTSSEVAEILNTIPSRPVYQDWILVISAVGSVLPDDEAASVLNMWSPEESSGEYLRKLRSGLKHSGIGTLINMAKQHGFDASAFARRRAARMKGLADTARPVHGIRQATRAKFAKKLPHYTARRGTADDLSGLAQLRRLPSADGLAMMQAAGCLAFADDLTDVDADGRWSPVKAWLVLDPSGRNVSARRLDGHGWNCINGAKARCISGPGSKHWPVGLMLAKPSQRLDVVEGEGDLVALWHLHSLAKVTDAAPVGLLGSCVNLEALPQEASSYIAGRTIQIFMHRDSSGTGQAAAKKWSDSFYRLGAAAVRARDLSMWLGQNGKDLNDAVTEANAVERTDLNSQGTSS